ncbi:hypothetical protein ABT084_36600 [Streptomyces sp. NPDC002138]|uniref:hypothetical protein n=1 Tax=Streptomyces sp. NPDC002138 TaxID=3154410 RepID=UPI0033217DB5
MNTVTIAGCLVMVGEVSALLGLWLRLRWRVQYERARHHAFTDAAEVVSRGGRLELDSQGDGHRLRVRITHARAEEEEGAA